MAPERGRQGPGTIFEDEFFRQLVGGQLADDEAQSERPPIAPETEVEPEPQALSGGGRRPPRRPVQVWSQRPRPSLSPRVVRAGALVAGALVIATAVALVRSGQAPPPSSDGRGAAQAPAPVPPVDPRGLASGGGAEPSEIAVAWAGVPREDGHGPARLAVRWVPDRQLTIEGRLKAPGTFDAKAGTVAVLAADADRRDATEARVGSLRPDSEGRFRTAVSIDRGAPRKLLTFVHRGPAEGSTLRASALLEVHGTLVAWVRRRAGSVIVGGRTSPGRAAIEIEARHPGARRWRGGTALRSDAAGRWEIAYRPQARPGLHEFRVRMRGESGRGFLSTTRTLATTVRR